MMKLYSAIGQRKSCRKYDMQPLEPDLMSEIEGAIESFEPLFPDVPVQWRFSRKIAGRFHVEAPHYLILGGEGKPGELENIGFLFQQLVLWFDLKGLGSVWLGASTDADGGEKKGDILAIGFGRTTEPVHRAANEYKRKPIEKITNAPDDPCIQAAHLAPSGMNGQPWYFEKQGGEVWVYRQNLKPPFSLLYKHADIDMGIALCHYAQCCKELGKPFGFTRSAALPDKPGYTSFGMIS